MKIVEEPIAARSQRSDLQSDGRAGRDDFLDAKRVTFEFRRSGIGILDDDRQFPIGWRCHLCRDKPAAFERQLNCRSLGPAGCCKSRDAQNHGRSYRRVSH